MEVENPVVAVRRRLGLARQADLAALAGVGAGTITAVERGYAAQIPVVILDALEPYLPSMGETRVGLQARYSAWRGGLSEEVRERVEKLVRCQRIYPGVELTPDDEAAVDVLLNPGRD